MHLSSSLLNLNLDYQMLIMQKPKQNDVENIGQEGKLHFNSTH